MITEIEKLITNTFGDCYELQVRVNNTYVFKVEYSIEDYILLYNMIDTSSDSYQKYCWVLVKNDKEVHSDDLNICLAVMVNELLLVNLVRLITELEDICFPESTKKLFVVKENAIE